MNSNFTKFKSMLVEREQSCFSNNIKETIKEEIDSRIIFREEKAIGDFTFNLFTFICHHLKPLEELLQNNKYQEECFIEKYETTLIIEYKNNTTNENIVISDLFTKLHDDIDTSKKY